MNTKQKAASYAFPSILNIYGIREEQTGMTLRDWFAANASEQDIQDFLPQDRREECAFKKEHGFWPEFCSGLFCLGFNKEQV